MSKEPADKVLPITPRKVFLGTANRRQMYALFNRHHQAPFDDDRVSGRLYAGEWFRVDRAGFHEMQEVLPPRYVAADAFALCEYLAGSVTSVFYELRSEGEIRYYHAYCDLGDRSTIAGMREAIIAREATTPSLIREEALEHIWSTTDDDFRGYADGDSRLRTILVYEPALGTVLKRLHDLTTAEVAELLLPRLPRLAA